jgi:hypothetical protein
MEVIFDTFKRRNFQELIGTLVSTRKRMQQDEMSKSGDGDAEDPGNVPGKTKRGRLARQTSRNEQNVHRGVREKLMQKKVQIWNRQNLGKNACVIYVCMHNTNTTCVCASLTNTV